MPYLRLTLGDLLVQLGLRWDKVPFWTDQEATRAVNDTLRVWNLLTGYWRRRVVLATVANQVWYTVPGTLVLPLRVTFGTLRLDQGSIIEWDDGRPAWEAETTFSGDDVPQHPVSVAPAGLSLLAIWPADALGGTTLVIDGVRATPVLTLGGGEWVNVGDDLIGILLGEVLHTLSFKVGGTTFSGTFALHQQFLAAATDENDVLATAEVFRAALGADRMPQERMVRGAVTAAATPPGAVPQG